MSKVNVGCGMTPTLGWLNYDNSWSVRLASYPTVSLLLEKIRLIGPTQSAFIKFVKENQILYADASRHIPLPDNSVDILYCSHMLEHLTKEDRESFLCEVVRVLRKDGIFRVSVPDLKRFVTEYLTNGDADIFCRKLLMNDEMPKTILGRVRRIVVGDRHHQWNYDGKSLTRLLEQYGFYNCTVLEAGVTTVADPGSLDLYERMHESLYVEARKI